MGNTVMLISYLKSEKILCERIFMLNTELKGQDDPDTAKNLAQRIDLLREELYDIREVISILNEDGGNCNCKDA